METKSYLEVNLGAIENNLEKIKKQVGKEVTVATVIKANAYGMGTDIIKEAIEKEKIKIVIVATIEEAIKLRKEGYQQEIITLNELLPYEVENLVKDKGLSDKVIFYGITQDVPGILSVMDCFVLPSIFEGKPVVSIEEQVSGLYGIYSNTITKEVKLTNLIEYIDLNESKEFWANEILEKQKYVSNRKSMDKVIEEKGYGLESLRGNLERIYNR